MKYISKTLSAVFVLVCLSVQVSHAHNQVFIVASSSVREFAQHVALEFAKETVYPSPAIRTADSRESINNLVSNDESINADIILASRNLHSSVTAKANEDRDIIELPIGLDGILFVNDSNGSDFQLTREDIFLALAKDVPVNGKLIPNPYKTWRQIRSSLPDKKILVFGPVSGSGSRDAIDKEMIANFAARFPEYRDYCGPYQEIRNDGCYVGFVDEGQQFVDRLVKNSEAVGIVPYWCYMKNSSRIKYASVDGVDPSYEKIAKREYPFSRELFLYVRSSDVYGCYPLRDYIDLFLSEEMIGDFGQLHDIGLVTLLHRERLDTRRYWLKTSRE